MGALSLLELRTHDARWHALCRLYARDAILHRARRFVVNNRLIAHQPIRRNCPIFTLACVRLLRPTVDRGDATVHLRQRRQQFGAALLQRLLHRRALHVENLAAVALLHTNLNIQPESCSHCMSQPWVSAHGARIRPV